MNILMMTNTYLPNISGVSRSVAGFVWAFRSRGHRVVVVAPESDGIAADEDDVVRIPAIQHFNGSDFSIAVPIPGLLRRRLENFRPDLVLSNHPFLIGSTAVRVATQKGIPLVFTYHTNYEQYTHYVPGDSPRMRAFAIQLARGYCDLCDRVIAPSASIKRLLKTRGVTTPISVIPTGIRTNRFASGDGAAFRRSHDLPGEAFIAGYVGRLAPEKNLAFLSSAMARFMKERPNAHFLVVGSGSSRDDMEGIFSREGLAGRLHFTGAIDGQDLIDAYHAMDLFVFASRSETQGMVLAEAMAASVPVVALDAPGVRDIVSDGENGRLFRGISPDGFAAVVEEAVSLSSEVFDRWRRNAVDRARDFDLNGCADLLLDVYRQVCKAGFRSRDREIGFWESTMEQIRAEYGLVRNIAEAAALCLQEKKH